MSHYYPNTRNEKASGGGVSIGGPTLGTLEFSRFLKKMSEKEQRYSLRLYRDRD